VKKKRSKSRKSAAAVSADAVPAASATDGAKKKVTAVSPPVLAGESQLKAVKVKVEKDKAVEGGKTVKEEKAKAAVGDSKRADSVTATSVVSLSKKAMKKIITDLKAVEHAVPFLFPVELDDAPNYMDYVTHPMDLSTIEKHHKSGKYDGEGGTALFVSDMRLIWDNCVAYNDPVSEIAVWAVSLGDQFERMFRAVSIESSPPAAASHTVQSSAQVQTQAQIQVPAPAVPSSTVASQGEEIKGSEMRDDRPLKKKKIEKSANEPSGLPVKAPKRQDLGVIGKRCWKICKDMSADPRSEQFLHPIDLSQAPGYLDVVSRPLDITEVKNQLETYENNPRAFYADMMLIFDNCLAYNTEGSELWLQAAERKVTFDKMYMDAIGTDAQAHMLNRLCPPGDDNISPGLKKAGRPLGSTVAKKIEEAMGGAASSKSVDVASAAVVKVDPALVAAAARLAADAKAAAAVAAAAPPSLHLSVVPLKAGQRARSLDEIDRLLKILESPEGLAYQEVRDKAVKRARALVSSFETPCWSTAGLHEVLFFGEINPSPLFCTERYLYPKAYSVKRTVKLCLLPDTSSSSADSVGRKDASYFASSSSAAPFFPVEFTSMISSAVGADQPMFIVTIDG
jgi:Bromodomain